VTSNEFFEESTAGSAVKARIVSKYFWAWAKVLYRKPERQGRPLQYLDLFAGPGCYDDGTPSTPLLVIEKAIADASFRHLVLARLNDIDPKKCEALSHAIRSLPNLASLHYQPVIENRAVDVILTRQIEETELPPTLSFIDPWGYKGLSVRLIRALTKHWGCDCILFFNYNRINLALTNPFATEPVDEVFGKARADSLRGRLEGLAPRARESLILTEFKDAISEGGRRRAVEFGFEFDASDRTSHYLMLVTKEPVGFEIMQKIMARESSEAPQGIPSFQYIPTHRRRNGVQPEQLAFFDERKVVQPLELLQAQLLERFAGRSMPMIEVYREYNQVIHRYIPRNCKDALLALEAEGTISCDPPASKRPCYKGTPSMADWVRVTFPPRIVSSG
jgi:three-Cys-motif partner protein